MAICEEIIRSAYRRAGVSAAGVPLDATSMVVGLERLQGMYLTFVNGSVFGELCDYYLQSGNYTAEEGQRIYKNTHGSVITIPTTVKDKDTGKTRAPLDAAVIVVVDPANDPPIPNMWLYNRMLGQWQDISALQISDIAPLSMEFEDQLKDILGAYICDENGMQISPGLVKNASLGKLAIASRYANRRKANKAEYF